MFLARRNATGFCILTLYPTTLINSLSSLNSFSIDSSVFSHVHDHVTYKNKGSFSSSFLVLLHFVFFSCLPMLARHPSSLWGEVNTNTLALLLYIWGRGGRSIQSFTIDYHGSCIRAVYMPFTWFRKFSSITSLLRLSIMNRCWILSNAFPAFTKMIVWFFSFILLIRWITLIGFSNVDVNLAFQG